MPELPEVETVRRGLAPHIEGARIEEVILNRPNLRFAFPNDFAERLTGQVIVQVHRRAKYLLMALSGEETLLSHLGMTGNFRVSDQPQTIQKHDHVVMHLRRQDESARTLIYSDPRRFGFMDLYTDAADCAFLNRLGPEPLGNEMNAASLAVRFKARKSAIKSALLDQRNIAGLGNIYVCEALWRAGISPETPTGDLVKADGTPRRELEALSGTIRDVLEAAIAAGGSTLRDFRNSEGGAGYFQHAFDVYGREGERCHTKGCKGSIARIVQSGRSSFFCPVCQSKIS